MSDLVNRFKDENGFCEGTKAPHKWVLQAEQELRIQAARITALEAERDEAYARGYHDCQQKGITEGQLWIVDSPHVQAVKAERDRLRVALKIYIYETTHLSPEESDGSHWCKISKSCLETARAALAGGE